MLLMTLTFVAAAGKKTKHIFLRNDETDPSTI